jgi:sRNA-binding protein
MMRKDVIKLLSEKYPRTFSCVDRERKPLKIGIHLDILAALGEAITPDELKQALKVYTSNGHYKGQLILGATRYDLNGAPCGRVTAEHLAPRPPAPAAPAKPAPTAKLAAPVTRGLRRPSRAPVVVVMKKSRSVKK